MAAAFGFTPGLMLGLRRDDHDKQAMEGASLNNLKALSRIAILSVDCRKVGA